MSIVAWPKGTDPRTPEEREALRRAGKLKADKLRDEMKRHNTKAKKERKIQKLHDLGQDGRTEAKKMRVHHYGGSQVSAGLAWQPKGKKAARGKQYTRKSAPK